MTGGAAATAGDAAPEVDVRRELSRVDLPARVRALGFDEQDAPLVVEAAAAVLSRPEDLAVVGRAAARLTVRTGLLPAPDVGEAWDGLAIDDDGVLALLALLATAPVVRRFHASRDVPEDVSAATLADLGRQATVHRLVSGRFGLGTYAWLAGTAWSGALYALGRLQLALERVRTVDGSGSEWVLSTHIPRAGRLTPHDVDASLRRAPGFFAEHFPEIAAPDVYCRSWMLDPRLPELLPGSNLAAFQRRWRTYGEPGPGDADALFFAFERRGPVDLGTLAELPARTALQRGLRSVWRAGGHWHVVEGRLSKETLP